MKNERFENTIDVKTKLIQIKDLKFDLFKALKSLSFNDIQLKKTANHNNDTYLILFPLEINFLYNELKLIHDNEEIERKKELYFYEIYNDESNKHDELAIRIQIYREDINRIHNPGNGLSQTFRNLGIGKKIFKRIIKEVGYITSEHRDNFDQIKNSIQSDLLWYSLYNDNDVICKTNGNNFFAYLNEGVNYNQECNNYLKI